MGLLHIVCVFDGHVLVLNNNNISSLYFKKKSLWSRCGNFAVIHSCVYIACLTLGYLLAGTEWWSGYGNFLQLLREVWAKSDSS
jgi:hypothetical protein